MDSVPFNQQLTLALLVGAVSILASAVTGAFTYFATARQRKLEDLTGELRRTYRDIAAFHRLEKSYTEELARVSESRTAESWKQELRRKLREHDPTPSDKATAHYAEARIEELC